MAFRFRRTLSILPGLRLNLGKRGVSLSAGLRGARITFGRRGITKTIGFPGTGLSYSWRSHFLPRKEREEIAEDAIESLQLVQVEYRRRGKKAGPTDLLSVVIMIQDRRLPEDVAIRDVGSEEWRRVPPIMLEAFYRLFGRRRRALLEKILIVSTIAAVTALGIVRLRHGMHPATTELQMANSATSTPLSLGSAASRPIATPSRMTKHPRPTREQVIAEIERRYGAKPVPTPQPLR